MFQKEHQTLVFSPNQENMNNGGYPAGAEYDKSAPYNESPDNTKKKVCVSVTYSQEFTLSVPEEISEEMLLERAREEISSSLSYMKKEGWIEDELIIEPL